MSVGSNHGRAQAGFTLLELLIALALLSLLTLALYGSLHNGTRVWEATNASTADAETIRAAQEQITEIIASAYPKRVAEDATHTSLAFDGEPGALHLLAPDPSLNGALADTTIEAHASDGKLILVVTRALELADTPKMQPHILLANLNAFSFRYFGPDKPDGKPVWHDRWARRLSLPLLVQVNASFIGHHATWPDLIVRPQITGSVGCTFDALTKSCQVRG